MGDITLNQMKDLLLWLIGFGGATATIVKAVKTTIKSAFKPIEAKIDTVDMNSTKNFLVQQIAEIDRNGYIDTTVKARFYEQYDHYTNDLKGNHYIKEEVERLKKEGKL